MNLLSATIPHKAQRYPTVGDWTFQGSTLSIRVSEMGDWRYESLVSLHELIEAILCRYEGVSEEDVTNFDIQFEKRRKVGDNSEPGDAEDAPYREQHQFATQIERMVAERLGVDWHDYDSAVLAL